MRDIKVNIRITEEERRNLQSVAARYNLDMARLIRAAVNLVATQKPELNAAHTEKILPVQSN